MARTRARPGTAFLFSSDGLVAVLVKTVVFVFVRVNPLPSSSRRAALCRSFVSSSCCSFARS